MMRHPWIPAPSATRVIEDAAATWLVRVSEGDIDAIDAVGAWLDEDPRHRTAYEALRETWNDIAVFDELGELVSPDRDRSRTWLARCSTGLSRPLAVVAALSASIVLLFAALPPAPPRAFETVVSELKRVQLEDGTLVTLGPDTVLAVAFNPTERRVVLKSGEAFFEVAHEAGRRFLVEAGAARIGVSGTKFDVRRREGRVAVAVLEGTVRVAGGRERRVQILRAGQTVTVTGRDTPFTRAASFNPVGETGAAPAGDWRFGRLTYRGERLADVAADINRYYAPGLTVAPDAANIRIAASFRADDVEGFLNVLDKALPLKVTRAADGAYHAQAKSR